MNLLATKSNWQLVSLLVIGALFVSAGLNHFARPGFYLKITPAFVPWPLALITLSGIFEIIGGVGVLIPRLRRTAAWGLIALLIVVSPLHIDMLVRGDEFPELPIWGLVGRLLLQPLLIAWVWWTALTPATIQTE